MMQARENKDFKVVGYYPCWVPEGLEKVDFDVVTHVYYAFVIPTEQGTLLPMRNPDAAKKLIASAHAKGAKALVVVGGWDYLGVRLEKTFADATDTPEKRTHLADEIMEICLQYGFDGVDIDWEYPRLGNPSAIQYELLMMDLGQRLHSRDLLLTCAVHAGALPEGGILPDAAAQSDQVLGICDWINIMAYDGGDGKDHSPFSYAVACADYWHKDRGLPREKVVLGVPFYARSSWASYDSILSRDPEAWSRDVTTCDGSESYYNGVATMEQKAAYAKENLGGVMIWELTQDTSDREKSLLQAIGRAIR